MERWPVQLMIFILLAGAAISGTILYRKNILAKVCFTFILTWVYHAMLFYAVLLGRVWCYHGEPGFDPFIIFWGNVVNLHAVLAVVFTFVSFSRVKKGG